MITKTMSFKRMIQYIKENKGKKAYNSINNSVYYQDDLIVIKVELLNGKSTIINSFNYDEIFSYYTEYESN